MNKQEFITNYLNESNLISDLIYGQDIYEYWHNSEFQKFAVNLYKENMPFLHKLFIKPLDAAFYYLYRPLCGVAHLFPENNYIVKTDGFKELFFSLVYDEISNYTYNKKCKGIAITFYAILFEMVVNVLSGLQNETFYTQVDGKTVAINKNKMTQKKQTDHIIDTIKKEDLIAKMAKQTNTQEIIDIISNEIVFIHKGDSHYDIDLDNETKEWISDYATHINDSITGLIEICRKHPNEPLLQKVYSNKFRTKYQDDYETTPDKQRKTLNTAKSVYNTTAWYVMNQVKE